MSEDDVPRADADGSTVPSEEARAAIELLWSAPAVGADVSTRGAQMPADLRHWYGGPLEVPLRPDRPTVLANFVSSLDGVVALAASGVTGGAEISGSFEPDRFVMGLVRSVADAIVVGAGTLRASPGHRWTPGGVNPASATASAAWRRAMGLAPAPLTVIVSTSGRLDPTHAGLADPAIPVVIATTEAGARSAAGLGFGAHVTIAPMGGDSVPVSAVASYLGSLGARVILCEGGPHLLAEFVEADLLDELFLTISPQLVGRGPGTSRLALLEGAGPPAGFDTWGRIRSVRRAGDHLFLRYGLTRG